jgi:hypothetical protein
MTGAQRDAAMCATGPVATMMLLLWYAIIPAIAVIIITFNVSGGWSRDVSEKLLENCLSVLRKKTSR